MDDKDKDYDVGYGKPPKHTQFKKNQSGNPRGRPKGTKNLKTDLREVLNEKVQVSNGGRTQTVSKQRAMVMRTFEQALSGNVRAIELLMKLSLQYLDGAQTAKDAPLSPDEDAILKNFFNQNNPPKHGEENDGID